MARLDAYLKVVTNLMASALRSGLSFSLGLCRTVEALRAGLVARCVVHLQRYGSLRAQRVIATRRPASLTRCNLTCLEQHHSATQVRLPAAAQSIVSPFRPCALLASPTHYRRLKAT